MPGLIEWATDDRRRSDRRATRPSGLVYWIEDRPPPLAAFGLALQHLAIQSVYIVLPTAMAMSLTQDPAEITRFVSLSILGWAIWQALQLVARGPIGSGYPLPATSTPAMLGSVALAGALGTDFPTMAGMVVVSGMVCFLAGFLMHRPRLFLPNEVAGVVVILIGVALVILGTRVVGLQGAELPATETLAVAGASLLAMVATALSRTRAAPFAVLIGAVLGSLIALTAGQGRPDAAAVLAAQPWLALPEPWLPRFDTIQAAPMASFLITMVAAMATAFGSLVVLQRASDSGWTRPDGPPIRRGLLANGIGIVAAGMIGGALPGPATAAVGLSVATGTLARRIVWIGTVLLLVLALCPKLVAVFVLMPAAAKGATLLYVAGFLMTQGCQLVTARLLDTRRSMIVAFGLAGGIAAAIAPQAFLAGLPSLASPLAFGAAAAFAVHLATLPLVRRRVERRVPINAGTAREVTEWFGGLGASWGLKPQTVRAAENALTELLDLLAARRVKEVTLEAALAEDRVRLRLAWSGPALPEPAARPRAEDLLGSDEAREAFAVWLATRGAQGFAQREVSSADGKGREARLVFED